MIAAPFYDPERSYSDNYTAGPFGAFADSQISSPVAPPQHTFLGHPVHLPFGIPAGPLVNAAFVKAALDKGFDLPTYKTVRTRAHASHAWPNVLAVHPAGELIPGQRLTADRAYTQPLSITNSFGVPSFSPDIWQPDLASAVAHARPGQVVIGSFQGTKSGSVTDYIADFALGARLLRETGVPVVEVNLSCPNEGTSALLCFDVDRSRAVCEALRAELGDIPLLIKIAYFADDALLRRLITAVAPFINGIAAINTISAEIISTTGAPALPGEGRLTSGVCGACIRWAGLEMTRRLAAARGDLTLNYAIVGTGGVTVAEDYALYRTAGADAVMSATGAMWDPHLAQRLKVTVSQQRQLEPLMQPDASNELATAVADALLAIGAVGFSPHAPITFKSGLLSPVYCDNRRFPFHPLQWTTVIRSFEQLLAPLHADVIGGIEAAGIPHSAALGFTTAMPSVFIRKEAKLHGTRKRVEGGDVNGLRVLLVEDLVTTGLSSLSGVTALREEGAIVTDCLAIISYGFVEAAEAFATAGVTLHTLTTFSVVLDRAVSHHLITPEDAADQSAPGSPAPTPGSPRIRLPNEPNPRQTRTPASPRQTRSSA